MIENEIRSPTEREALRTLAKGYLTERAAEFEQRFKEGKYQAAAYLLDTSDSIFVFAREIGILSREDGEWYRGTEEKEGIFSRAKEAVCRARVDGEEIQDEVQRRFDNLCFRLRNCFRYRMKEETSQTAVLILDEQLNDVKKARANRENRRLA